jgi:hypothetical protein
VERIRDHYLEIPLQVMHMLQQVSISSAFQMVKSRSFGSNTILLIGDEGYFEFQTRDRIILTKMYTVLLLHANSDHADYISFLHEKIPIYMGKACHLAGNRLPFTICINGLCCFSIFYCKILI